MSLVMKFGGTSVGSADAIRRTAELIQRFKAEWGDVVVVASAMGTKPVKVTDILLNGSKSALAGDVAAYKTAAEQMRTAHFTAIDELIVDVADRDALKAEIEGFVTRFLAICGAIAALQEISPRTADVIGGMGEQMSVRVVAAYLRQCDTPAEAIDATELIVTDDEFQSATPLIEMTNAKAGSRLKPLMADGVIPVVTGFIAATADGVTTTLGRGGSDYSASILGRAVNAKEVWIWTDVDGVMTTDPRIVDNARTIPVLTYNEVSELAYYGANVLHPRTMRPVMEEGIPLRIKNTFNPDHDGSVIVSNDKRSRNGIKAVTAIKRLNMVTVEGRGMLGVPGVAARTFQAVAQTKASVLMITQSSSEQSICFVVPENTAAGVVAALNDAFSDEIKNRDIERVSGFDEIAIVTAVGAGMRGVPGIAGEMFSALGRGEVNIVAIAQGSSECSISVVISESDVQEAVKAVHALAVNQPS